MAEMLCRQSTVTSGDTLVLALEHFNRASTNCGSCRVEIRRLIDAAALKKAV
jgi:assimilatory nitrate reductase catalytic subunit